MDDPTRPPTTAEIAERMTSRIANSLVIAAGIVGLGIYASGPGDVEAAEYQIVATSDGRVVRLNTDTGSIVSCDSARCTLILMRSDDLERLSEDERKAIEARQRALPSPAPTPSNGVAPATPQAPQPAPAPQPAQPQR